MKTEVRTKSGHLVGTIDCAENLLKSYMVAFPIIDYGFPAQIQIPLANWRDVVKGVIRKVFLVASRDVPMLRRCPGFEEKQEFRHYNPVEWIDI